MSKEKITLSFEKSRTRNVTVDAATQPKHPGPDETSRLYATSCAIDEFAEALSYYVAEADEIKENIMTSKSMIAKTRFASRCIEIAQKVIDAEKPEKEYLCIEKYETREGCNQMTVDLEDNVIIFKVGEGPYHTSGSFLCRSRRPPNSYERYKFDPAVKIHLANYIGFKVFIANSLSTSYDESLPLKKAIVEPTAIITPGIFEVIQADRIKPGTVIAWMRLYKEDV